MGWPCSPQAIPTVTPAQFVAMFPEFANDVDFPIASVQSWINQAPNGINAGMMGNEATLGIMLYAAHNLTLGAAAARAARAGGVPGQQAGLMTSKSAGGLAASYDVGSIAVKGAGDFNMTAYGIRLATLLRKYRLGSAFIPSPSCGPLPW